MIEQATIDYLLDNLKARGLIEKGVRTNIKFTDAGHAYTSKRSRDSWCDIVWYGDSLWVPVTGQEIRPNHNYGWDFIKFNKLKDFQIKLFMDYFEIDDMINEVCEIDDIYL
jgi:hypothetical protein